MSGLNIGIAGAGLLGRLLAWTLSHQGHRVSVFDPAASAQPAFDGKGPAGFTAAGMLSPVAERETAEPDVASLGWRSIMLWAQVHTAMSTRLAEPPSFRHRGSLLVAHGPDIGAARRVLSHLEGAWTQPDPRPPEAQREPEALSARQLREVEPCLHSALGPLHAWMLHGEGQIDTLRMMMALHDDAPDVQWHWASTVEQVSARELSVRHEGATQHRAFDWVFDVRGVGARPDLPVRGVRGEVVWLHAPGLTLQRPVRLLHPRHRVYIVPRPGDLVLVGASEIESEDRSPMSLRTAVELMAAAHSVIPDLAEARIVRMDINLRPALPNHRPIIHVEAGLTRINGLYRHGWLLAPAVLDQALQQTALPSHS